MMMVTGLLQAVALVVFAMSIVVESERVNSTVGKPIAEAVIYAVFAVALAGLTSQLGRGRSWARTPFLVMQLFALIVGYTLLKGSGDWAHAAGAAVVASAVLAATGALRAT